MLLFCVASSFTLVSWEDLGTKLCSHNQEELVSVHDIKVSVKAVLKRDFVYVET